MNSVNNGVYIRYTKRNKRLDEVVTNPSQQFYGDVIEGLSGFPKRLPSKYFYDATGDQLFQEIMHCADYYPTRCEFEIFTTKVSEMADLLVKDEIPFDLIELGPGDCYKSLHLMKELTRRKTTFNYIPIDISGAILDHLEINLRSVFPRMPMQCMHAEYFQGLARARKYCANRKVILCLGGNIGNMTVAESYVFCENLRAHLSPGDLVITGFDLIKNPRIIRAAYNDREGITKKFNLNLLERINRELGANFNPDEFEHYCSYEPETGACKSFLVCMADKIVFIGDTAIAFRKNECIWMEISQKYSIEQIDDMAQANGFRSVTNLMDRKKWFVDACWEAI